MDAPPAPAIILVKPQLGENIGAAARAMANFGLRELRLVAPREPWPNEKARAAAAGAGHVLERTKLFSSAQEAIADLHFIGAATARPREMVKRVLTPETAVKEMIGRSRAGQRCGMLFGPERAGLDNDQAALADVLVMAPVNPAFASLNLAQAVLLTAYEWRKHTAGADLGRQTRYDGPAREGFNLANMRPASRAELLTFFKHLEKELDLSGFLRPPEKRAIMLRNIRTMFERMEATTQEVRTLHGIVASLTHPRRRGPEPV